MDDERLIVEVEQHNIIYDTRHPFYKDNTRKDKAWHLIAGVLGVDADTCKTRWKALRDAYVKHKKKPLPSGSAGGTQKDWKYAEIMSFLLPHIQPRSSRSNLSLLQLEEERSGTPLSDRSEGRSSTPQPSISPAPSTSAPPASRSRSPRDRTSTSTRPAVAAQAPRRGQRQTEPGIGERLMSLLEQPAPKPHMPDGELDEAYHFALSIVPMLHRLNKDRRQQAKIEILQVLHNLERGQTIIQPPPLPPPTLGQTPHPPHFQPPPHTPLPSPTPRHSSHFQPIHPPHTQTGSFTAMLRSDWEDPTAMGPYYTDT